MASHLLESAALLTLSVAERGLPQISPQACAAPEVLVHGRNAGPNETGAPYIRTTSRWLLAGSTKSLSCGGGNDA